MRSAVDATDAELAAIVAELELRKACADALRRQLFAKQLETCDDPAQFRALHCGRGAGKSELIPRAAILDAIDAGFEEYVIIGAETQKKARALHWYKLKRAAKRAGIELAENKQEGTFRTPWGSVILFWGITDEGSADLLRGFNVFSAYFDEVATYASLLKYLVEDVMHPALARSLRPGGGRLTLCGTPSITRAGDWFEICEGDDAANWSVHHWTMLENERFPGGMERARAEFDKAVARYGASSAKVQREWRGLFVNDPGMQVYRYVPDHNDVWCVAPAGYDKSWPHTIAVDFGTSSACAWSAITSAPTSKRAHILKSAKKVGMLTGQAAKETARWCEEYNPDRLVGDAGGLGKAYVEEWNRRYAGRTRAEIEALAGVDEGEEASVQLPSRRPGDYVMPRMEAAEKDEKRAGIDFVNGELAAPEPTIVLCQPACKPLSKELLSLPWADETRMKEKAGHENHCADTMLYGVRTHMAYLNEAEEPKKDTTRMAPDDPDFIEREIEELRRENERDWWDQ